MSTANTGIRKGQINHVHVHPKGRNYKPDATKSQLLQARQNLHNQRHIIIQCRSKKVTQNTCKYAQRHCRSVTVPYKFCSVVLAAVRFIYAIRIPLPYNEYETDIATTSTGTFFDRYCTLIGASPHRRATRSQCTHIYRFVHYPHTAIDIVQPYAICSNRHMKTFVISSF